MLNNQASFLNQNGPVIIIEDDIDDQEMLTEVFQNLKYQNELLFFLLTEKKHLNL